MQCQTQKNRLSVSSAPTYCGVGSQRELANMLDFNSIYLDESVTWNTLSDSSKNCENIPLIYRHVSAKMCSQSEECNKHGFLCLYDNDTIIFPFTKTQFMSSSLNLKTNEFSLSFQSVHCKKKHNLIYVRTSHIDWLDCRILFGVELLGIRSQMEPILKIPLLWRSIINDKKQPLFYQIYFHSVSFPMRIFNATQNL